MLDKPHCFEDIVGHTQYIELLKEHLKNDSLPHFIIFNGPEGLGKTSLANVLAITINYGFDSSPEKDRAIENVIDKDLPIDCIKKFNMAKDSGKDTAREVLSEFNSTLSSTGKKVIICDECHGMSEGAQDTFLVDTEFMKSRTYLIMCTTNKEKLKATLLSRAVVFNLRNLKLQDMVSMLERVAERKNLKLQKGVLRMVAEWSNNRPRAALNILNAFGENKAISNDMIKEFIGYIKLEEILPLLSSLSGSMTMGLSIISEMSIPDNFVDLVVQALMVKTGNPSYKLSAEEYKNARRELINVPEENLLKFLHKVSSFPVLTKSGIISAYTYAHVSYERLFTHDKTVLQEEIAQKMSNLSLAPDISLNQRGAAPTFDDLLADSSFIGGE